MGNISDITDFLEHLGDAILVADDTSEIIFANSACARLFGYQKDHMQQLRIDDLMARPEVPDHAKSVRNYINLNSPAKEMMERGSIPCVDAEGRRFNARISITNVKIDETRYGVAIIQDYTSIQNMISTLESNSNVDVLTNLFNRRYLQEVMKANSRVLSTWSSLGVLYLDLDGFKSVNDGLGHAAGDTLLKVVANRLKDSVRFDDIIFRVGGDEFLIFLNLTEVSARPEMLRNISDKICRLVAEPIPVQNNSAEIGVSIGAGIYPDQTDDLNELIRQADKAMYLAKKSGEAVLFVDQLPDN